MDNPVIFNTIRRIIEFNFISINRTIKNELWKSGKYVKVLDIPCGTGEFSPLFEFNSYTGADISERYIEYAKKNYKKNFVCCNAINTGFVSEYFNQILVVGFFHHLNDSEIEAVLYEFKNILKNNGKLLVIEDAPTTKNINIIGKLLQKLDVGANIRPADIYKIWFSKYFTVIKYYHLFSGFWDYSVFVLEKK